MISVIDYGMGNLGSVVNMLRKSRIEHRVSSNPDDIEKAERLILPGVGAFDVGVSKLKATGIWQAMRIAVEEREARFLGICLGMQLLARGSEEGDSEGLGWVDSVAQKFRFDESAKEGRFRLRVPHMAWRDVRVTQECPLFDDLIPSRFYFVHSYFVPTGLPETVAEATHGHPFTAAVAKDRVFGAQFHPEKSHAFGMQFFANFSKL